MVAWALTVGLLTLSSLAAMALVRILGARSSRMLLVAGVFGGMLSGTFLVAAGSAMSTAVTPSDVLSRGGGIGAAIGLVAGLLAVATRRVWSRSRS